MSTVRSNGLRNTHLDSGNDVPAIVSRRIRLVFDAESIQQSGFMVFVTAWEALTPPSCCFIPKFEYDKLADVTQTIIDKLVSNRRMSILNCGTESDYSPIFERFQAMNAQNIGFVLGEGTDGKAVLAANKCNLPNVRLYQIVETGQLKFRFIHGQSDSKRDSSGGESHSLYQNQPYSGFLIATKPEALVIHLLRHRCTFGVGTTVYDSQQQPIQLIRETMVNADSITYTTNRPGLWAKIYATKSMTTLSEEKCRRMLSKSVHIEGLCWPIDLICDADGIFAGILIPESAGVPMSQCVMKGIEHGIRKFFPHWDKRHLTKLSVTILKKISDMHHMGILFGCLNPASILVKDENTVYFTDVDQYQIEGFPCFMRNITFTPPELQEKLRKNIVYFCTRDHEKYAVALLLFMLLMPGKMPYPIEDSAHAPDSILKQQFAFSYRGQHGSDRSVGSWRFVWSHLSPQLKEAFFKTFQNGESANIPVNRLTDGRWLRLIESFLSELNEKDLFDPRSRDLLPQSFKRARNIEFVRCRYCGIEHPRFYFRNEYFSDYQICNSCLEKPSKISFTCVDCGRTFIYTNKTAILHERKRDQGWKAQKHCQDCKSKMTTCLECRRTVPLYRTNNGVCFDCENRKREREQARKNSIYTTIRCRDCGRYFDIAVGEHESLVSKGLHDPVRCKTCRRARHNRF